MKRGKKYVEAAKTIDRGTLYDVADAVSLVKKTATAKFDETIEVHIRTGCDGRHADSRFVEQLFCRTELVKRFVFLYLRKMPKLKKLKQPEQIS